VNAAEFITESLAEVARRRADYAKALEHVAVPGATVWVLHDGRRGWMHGESGTVVWANREWAEVAFPGIGQRRFRLKFLSRQPGGIDCWRGLVSAGAAAGWLATDR
jgi:hypothetical protein